MKQIKVRWQGVDGEYHYKEYAFPNDVSLLIGHDETGREIYDGDVVLHDGANALQIPCRPVSVELTIALYDNDGRTSWFTKSEAAKYHWRF